VSPADLLASLIRIPSVNPDGDPGVPDPGEGKIAEFLADTLTAMGARVCLHEVLPGRPNVVSGFPSDRPGKPRLLLAPHTDTVSVVGMTIDPFAAEIRGGRMYGRGASDTKGPMAAMLWALREVGAGRLASLGWEIWFAGLMGEEAGLHGSKALAATETFDFVIAGEPTDMRAVRAHKGSAWLTLEATGRSAHASTPEAGINAIDAAIAAIARVRAAFEAAPCHHAVLGSPTLSVGTIQGGSKVNVVPDHCQVGIDVRTVPGFDAAALARAAEAPNVRAVLAVSSPLDTDPGHPVLGILRGMGIEPTTAPWFCDAASFATVGTPAIALGPGSIAQAHTCDEFIEIAALEAGAAAFREFLLRL